MGYIEEFQLIFITSMRYPKIIFRIGDLYNNPVRVSLFEMISSPTFFAASLATV